MLRKSILTSVLLLPLAVSGAEGFMPWTDVFAKADTDADDALSLQEITDHPLGKDFQGFQPWMRDHFAELDTDTNGVVTRSELEAGKARMKMTDEQLSRAFFKQQGFMPKNQQ